MNRRRPIRLPFNVILEFLLDARRTCFFPDEGKITPNTRLDDILPRKANIITFLNSIEKAFKLDCIRLSDFMISNLKVSDTIRLIDINNTKKLGSMGRKSNLKYLRSLLEHEDRYGFKSEDVLLAIDKASNKINKHDIYSRIYVLEANRIERPDDCTDIIWLSKYKHVKQQYEVHKQWNGKTIEEMGKRKIGTPEIL